jgi:hypothetical protein
MATATLPYCLHTAGTQQYYPEGGRTADNQSGIGKQCFWEQIHGACHKVEMLQVLLVYVYLCL